MPRLRYDCLTLVPSTFTAFLLHLNSDVNLFLRRLNLLPANGDVIDLLDEDIDNDDDIYDYDVVEPEQEEIEVAPEKEEEIEDESKFLQTTVIVDIGEPEAKPDVERYSMFGN